MHFQTFEFANFIQTCGYKYMYSKLFAVQEETLKVVANQKRLEIIQLLSNGELSVGEMVEMLGIRQANLSQHLMLLRDARIVTTRRNGVTIYYRITDQRVAEACGLIKEFLKIQHSEDPAIAEMLVRSGADLYPVVQNQVCKMRISLSEAVGSESLNGANYYF